MEEATPPRERPRGSAMDSNESREHPAGANMDEGLPPALATAPISQSTRPAITYADSNSVSTFFTVESTIDSLVNPNSKTSLPEVEDFLRVAARRTNEELCDMLGIEGKHKINMVRDRIRKSVVRLTEAYAIPFDDILNAFNATRESSGTNARRKKAKIEKSRKTKEANAQAQAGVSEGSIHPPTSGNEPNLEEPSQAPLPATSCQGDHMREHARPAGYIFPLQHDHSVDVSSPNHDLTETATMASTSKGRSRRAIGRVDGGSLRLLRSGETPLEQGAYICQPPPKNPPYGHIYWTIPDTAPVLPGNGGAVSPPPPPSLTNPSPRALPVTAHSPPATTNQGTFRPVNAWQSPASTTKEEPALRRSSRASRPSQRVSGFQPPQQTGPAAVWPQQQQQRSLRLQPPAPRRASAPNPSYTPTHLRLGQEQATQPQQNAAQPSARMATATSPASHMSPPTILQPRPQQQQQPPAANPQPRASQAQTLQPPSHPAQLPSYLTQSPSYPAQSAPTQAQIASQDTGLWVPAPADPVTERLRQQYGPRGPGGFPHNGYNGYNMGYGYNQGMNMMNSGYLAHGQGYGMPYGGQGSYLPGSQGGYQMSYGQAYQGHGGTTLQAQAQPPHPPHAPTSSQAPQQGPKEKVVIDISDDDDDVVQVPAPPAPAGRRSLAPRTTQTTPPVAPASTPTQASEDALFDAMEMDTNDSVLPLHLNDDDAPPTSWSNDDASSPYLNNNDPPVDNSDDIPMTISEDANMSDSNSLFDDREGLDIIVNDGGDFDHEIMEGYEIGPSQQFITVQEDAAMTLNKMMGPLSGIKFYGCDDFIDEPW